MHNLHTKLQVESKKNPPKKRWSERIADFAHLKYTARHGFDYIIIIVVDAAHNFILHTNTKGINVKW